jgi:putative tryptophan/tyrosine transport system substrate-binding protein
MMRRREFIAGLGGAVAWPLAVRAQQRAPTPRVPVVGFLHPARREGTENFIAAFRQGLAESGYVEGRNVAIEFRFADGHNDRLPGLAADLSGRRVTVLAAMQGDTAARAAKAAAATIPIVFMSASDPVEGGLVTSLNRPGGNLTGVTVFAADLMPKRLELLTEVVPNAAVIDLLVNPEGAIAAASTKDVEAAALTLGRQIRVLFARNEREIDDAFAMLVQRRAGALLVMSDSLFSDRAQQIATLTVRYAIPALHSRPVFTAAGGLMRYDVSLNDSYRWAGSYTGRILNGEKPGDLPVMQPTKFELVINRKTAKALGLTIPETLLATADEVIE